VTWPRVLCLLLLPALAFACSPDGAPRLTGSGRKVDHRDPGESFGDGTRLKSCPDRFCTPEAPRGTLAAQCPDGGVHAESRPWLVGGLCAPAAPRPTPAALCPSHQSSPDGICLPAPPALQLAACPDGWEATAFPRDGQRVDGGARVEGCVPLQPPSSCPPGTMPRIGYARCVPLGSGCPEGEWPSEEVLRQRAEGLAATAILYVRADAEPGGDGTRERPLATLTEAVGQATGGAIVALGRGTWVEQVSIDTDLALVGACVEGTRIEAGAGQGDLLTLGQGQIVVSDLSLGGGRTSVMVTGAQATARLTNLAVVGFGAAGVHIAGERVVHVSALRVEDNLPWPDQQPSGLLIDGGGQVFAEAVSVSDLAGVAFQVEGAPSHLELTDGWVVRVERGGAREGSAIDLGHGATVVARRVGFSALTDTGVTARHDDGSLELEHAWIARAGRFALRQGRGHLTARGLVIEDCEDALTFLGGHASLTDTLIAHADADPMTSSQVSILVSGGADVVAERLSVFDSVAQALSISDASLTLRDATLEGRGTGRAEATVVATRAAHVTLERVKVEVQGCSAIELHGDPDLGLTTLDARDLEIVGPRQAEACELSSALEAWPQTDAQIERLHVSHAASGLMAVGPASSVNLVDAVLDGTTAPGEGLHVDEGAQVEVRRASVTGFAGAGIFAQSAGTTLNLQDVQIGEIAAVDETQPGRGLELHAGARLTSERLRVEGASQVGVALYGDGAAAQGTPMAHLVDLQVIATAPTGFDAVSGVGMSLLEGASATVARGTLRGNTAVGAVVGGGSTLEASDLLVAGTLPHPGGVPAGRGLEVAAGGAIALTRALVLNNQDVGVLISGRRTYAALDDIAIVGTLPARDSQRFGRGLEVQDGATLTLRRALVQGNHQVGVAIVTGALATLDQLEVQDTRLAPCWPGCAPEAGGTGVAIWAEAIAEVTCMESHDNALAGLQVALGATCRIDGARLTGNRFAYDLRADTDTMLDLDDVCAVGNAQDRPTGGVPLPETATLLDFGR